MQRPIIYVAINSPLYHGFDYLLPKEFELPRIGTRVRVPFGKRKLVGVILKIKSKSKVEEKKLKYVEEVLDEKPIFDTKFLYFLKWASDYYIHPIGQVIFSAMPPSVRRGRSIENAVDCFWVAEKDVTKKDLEDLEKTPLQKKILEIISQSSQGIDKRELNQVSKNWNRPIESLINKGLITQQTKLLPLQDLDKKSSPIKLNNEQNKIIKKIGDSMLAYQCHLLDGITGSGKTEIYKELIKRVIKNNKQVLVIVPEISLTPQLKDRLVVQNNTRIASYHSGLSEKMRFESWKASLEGTSDIVLGTRSAVFLPIKNLGLIVVDEEHDISLKQHDGFRYNARDLAVYRAKQNNVPIILGSATPSSETYYNAKKNKYNHLKLRTRAGGASTPEVKVIDMNRQKIKEGFSLYMLDEIKEQLNKNKQILLFLNRRGFSPVLLCKKCGWIPKCPNCELNMTYHASKKKTQCHHCGHQESFTLRCPSCLSDDVLALGEGTQRIESFLKDEFPFSSVIRIDRDTTRKVGSLENALSEIKSQKHQILIGTQMLSKGHDFPNVDMVGILNIDQRLFSPDPRATERLAQLLIQVAGRAGRASKKGKVLLQTYIPESPVLKNLINKGYESWILDVLQERKKLNLPPYDYWAMIRAEANKYEAVEQFLSEAKTTISTMGDTIAHGPIPSLIPKIANRYRGQLIIQAHNRMYLKKAISLSVPHLNKLKSSRRVRWSLDIDPCELD